VAPHGRPGHRRTARRGPWVCVSRARANRSGTLGRRSTKESGELGCPRLEALPSRLQAQATDPATAVVLETTLIDFAGRGR
jgi:hypothetical protein